VRAALDKLRTKVVEIQTYTKEALARRRFIVQAIYFRLDPKPLLDSSAAPEESKRPRLEDRRVEFDLIMNDLLRRGRIQTARMFSREAKLHQGYSIDIDAVTSLKKISSAITSRDIATALEWCAENRLYLKKAQSRLEHDLLLRQFLNLVEAKDLLGAVAFARKHLVSHAHEYQTQRVMATLAFTQPIEQTPYADLVSPQSWIHLAQSFESEYKCTWGFNLQSPFEIALRLGLAVCKTEGCGGEASREGLKRKCPCCQPYLLRLAQRLPKNKTERSSLICRVGFFPLYWFIFRVAECACVDFVNSSLVCRSRACQWKTFWFYPTASVIVEPAWNV